MNSRLAWFTFASILLIILIVVGAIGLLLISQAYDTHYSDAVYPGVIVYGVDLSGMTIDEATLALQSALPDANSLSLTLSEGNRTWTRTWADLGIKLEPAATARLAYQIGREGAPAEQRSAQIGALLNGHPLPPVIVLPDPAQATAALETLAPEVDIPPVNASLAISAEGITPVAAKAGLALDIAGTVAALPHAVSISPEGLTMVLLTRQVEPAIGDPGPAKAQVEALLAHPFALSGEDLLTGFGTTWTIEPSTVVNWLGTNVIEDETGARIVVTVDDEPIRSHLDSLNEQLAGGVVAIDVDRTAPTIRAALEAGEHQAVAALSHPPRVYAVQPGDTLMSISRSHGFPAWRLVEANPAIDTDDLHPDQEIIIPSIDILYEYPLIMEQRIVIDISDQHLYAYENDALTYDYVCSTGIDTSPTLPGTFQILSKEEEAYASSWDLWMPHFMGVYRTAPDFTNGIHGLPTLSSGATLWAGYLGRPVSYGCIVLGLNEAETLFQWAELGTLVVIQD
jgi:lipoprotein-anchoring transpeptidase ErfK/SrfK